MTEQADQFAVGQVWRRKSDGLLVQIRNLKLFHGDVDIYWRGLGEQSKKSGAIWSFNLLRTYEFTGEIISQNP